MTDPTSSNTTLPKGSMILITGINGFIASHCADQALQHGYKVRGTTRSTERDQWLSDLFGKRYGNDVFELVEVKDMQQPGAFEKPIQGCSAVMHTATTITMDQDPAKVIPSTLAGTKEILETAAKTPSIERVVYTSSQLAVRHEKDTPLHVTQDTWNDSAVKASQSPSTMTDLPDLRKGMIVYAASKVLAEKTCFEFVTKKKPNFALNVVVPDFNIGPSLHPTMPASSSGLVKAMFLHNEKALERMKIAGPMYWIDVRDTARLHLAAAIFDDVRNERIWAVTAGFNFNDFADVFSKSDPTWKDTERVEGDPRDRSIYDLSRSSELLKKLGKDGFVGFEESLKANIAEESSARSNFL